MFTAEVKRIGYGAAEVLSPGATGRVIGITSRGFFVLLGEAQVVFGSKEPEASPLTLNLEMQREAWNSIEIGNVVAADEQGVQIGDALRLTWQPEALWKPPLPTVRVVDWRAIQARVQQTADILLGQKGSVGLGAFLAHLVELEDLPDGAESQLVWVRLDALRHAWVKGDAEGACQAALPLYGMGLGLTPSGDDVLAGLLLVLTRWGSLTPFGRADGGLARRLVEGARGRTTAISACILHSAAEGYADERLLHALDGIVTGKPSPEACAELLARYGGSSGVDALLGMAVGLG